MKYEKGFEYRTIAVERGWWIFKNKYIYLEKVKNNKVVERFLIYSES